MAGIKTILIKREDLIKHTDKLERKSEWENKENDLYIVMKFLYDVVKNYQYGVINGVEIYVCQPYFLDFNQRVQDKLTEWGVEFSAFAN